MDFGTRLAGAAEAMDDPDADLGRLQATYRHFRLVNRWIARWPTLYRTRIRPVLAAASAPDRRHPGCPRGAPVRLLDVGSGGGDVARLLQTLGDRDGLRLEVTGIDPDPRAWRYARDGGGGAEGGHPGSPVRFLPVRAETLVEQGERFEVVVSNHVLHHLEESEVRPFLETLARLATRRVVVSDLARSPLAWQLFSVGAALPRFRDSFLREDGLLSIRRSYTAGELARLVPPGWRVEAMAPFRLLALWEAPEADGPDGDPA